MKECYSIPLRGVAHGGYAPLAEPPVVYHPYLTVTPPLMHCLC